MHSIMFYTRFMNKIIFEKWQVQLRKGFLELCVLKSLENKEKAYGLEVLLLLKEIGLEVNEGTLYPLLNRMEKNGWLESTWDTQTDSGHPRRFYQLNDIGKELLPKMLITYQNYSHSLEQLEKSS